MRNLSRSTRAFLPPALLLLCGAFLFTACPPISDPKNPASRDAIASLKTAHLAYIDEFTEAAGKTWDDQNLATKTAALEKQFADAESAPATQASAPRKSALANLHARFKRHAGELQKRKAFFKAKAAATLKDPLTQNYDQALRGEDLR